MKKVFKISFVVIILLYLLLFFAYKNGYYKDLNREKTILTDEKIKEYEEDLKKGIDVTNKEYIVNRLNYDNGYTRFALKLSKKLETGLNTIIKAIFNKISKVIGE